MSMKRNLLIVAIAVGSSLPAFAATLSATTNDTRDLIFMNAAPSVAITWTPASGLYPAGAYADQQLLGTWTLVNPNGVYRNIRAQIDRSKGSAGPSATTIGLGTQNVAGKNNPSNLLVVQYGMYTSTPDASNTGWYNVSPSSSGFPTEIKLMINGAQTVAADTYTVGINAATYQ